MNFEFGNNPQTYFFIIGWLLVLAAPISNLLESRAKNKIIAESKGADEGDMYLELGHYFAKAGNTGAIISILGVVVWTAGVAIGWSK